MKDFESKNKEKFLASLVPASLQMQPGNHIQLKKNVFIKYKADKLTANFIDRGLAYCDTVSMQSAYPVDPSTTWSYFEIIVLELNPEGIISVGWSDEYLPFYKHVGNTANSYGYFSNGAIKSSKKLVHKNEPYKKGDIIGCGLSFLSSSLFFTLNGAIIHSSPIRQRLDKYFPSAAFYGMHESVRFNFGATPYKFDFMNYIENEMDASLSTILSEPICDQDINQIIASYLFVNGYRETLQIFMASANIRSKDVVIIETDTGNNSRCVNEEEKNSNKNQGVNIIFNLQPKKKITNFFKSIFSGGSSQNSKQQTPSSNLNENRQIIGNNTQTKNNNNLNKIQKCFNNKNLKNYENSYDSSAFGERSTIGQEILKWNTEKVFELISITFPNLFQNDELICHLHILQLLKYMINNQFELAVSYMHKYFSKNQKKSMLILMPNNNEIMKFKIEELIELVQYNQPSISRLGFLTTLNYRNYVAAAFNKFILNEKHYESLSTLEILLKTQKHIENKIHFHKSNQIPAKNK